MSTAKPKKQRAVPAPPPAPKRYCVPMPELGALIDVRESTVRSYIAHGCPTPPKTGGKRSANAWAKKARTWLAEHKARKVTEQKPTNQWDIDPDARRYQRDWQRTRSQRAQLDLDEKRGQLIRRDGVVEIAGKAVLACRGRLNVLVQKMTARLENVAAHVVCEELRAEVNDVCETFARGMSRTFEQFVNPADDCPFCEIHKRRSQEAEPC